MQRAFSAIALSLLTVSASASVAAAPVSVAGYLAQGFQIAAKTEEERALPGVAPYEDRRRLVHVTTYDLRRGQERVICTLAYDSQQDRFATACHPPG